MGKKHEQKKDSDTSLKEKCTALTELTRVKWRLKLCGSTAGVAVGLCPKLSPLGT